jgi:hypothetical protein
MSDDEYEIPLQDQRVFGAGIKRKRIHFVPSATSLSTTGTPKPTSSGREVANAYLSIVLPKKSSPTTLSTNTTGPADAVSIKNATPEAEICSVCHLPLSKSSPSTAPSKPHESSLAHQICLPHSHPPSHLDRSRKGLAYLSSYGWDPDSRLGLGAQGQGIQFPIKTQAKDDKLGLGVVVPDHVRSAKVVATRKGVTLGRNGKEKVEKLDAGKIRKMGDEDRKRRERLQEMFYRSEDVERYLGSG